MTALCFTRDGLQPFSNLLETVGVDSKGFCGYPLAALLSLSTTQGFTSSERVTAV